MPSLPRLCADCVQSLTPPEAENLRWWLVQQGGGAAARTGVVDEVVAGGEGRPRLCALEQVRVVAALAQLHHDVEQPRPVRACGRHSALSETYCKEQQFDVRCSRRPQARVGRCGGTNQHGAVSMAHALYALCSALEWHECRGCRRRFWSCFGTRTAVDGLDVLLQQRGVVLLLHLRHAHLQDGLLLWRQPLLHVALQPPQQERPQHLRGLAIRRLSRASKRRDPDDAAAGSRKASDNC